MCVLACEQKEQCEELIGGAWERRLAWCLLAVRHPALNSPPDVVLYADPSHECAPHYTPSLFYMPGFLALAPTPPPFHQKWRRAGSSTIQIKPYVSWWVNGLPGKDIDWMNSLAAFVVFASILNPDILIFNLSFLHIVLKSEPLHMNPEIVLNPSHLSTVLALPLLVATCPCLVSNRSAHLELCFVDSTELRWNSSSAGRQGAGLAWGMVVLKLLQLMLHKPTCSGAAMVFIWTSSAVSGNSYVCVWVAMVRAKKGTPAHDEQWY